MTKSKFMSFDLMVGGAILFAWFCVAIASCTGVQQVSGRSNQAMKAEWVSIAAGKSHSLAIRSDGTLWAWGGNGVGQLGDGTTDERHLPVQVGSDHDWRFAAARFAHTLAVKSDGTLWSWGEMGTGSWVTGRQPRESRLSKLVGINGHRSPLGAFLVPA